MIFHAHAQYTTYEGLGTRLHLKHTFYYLHVHDYAYYCISDPKGDGTQARGGKSQGSPLLYATLFTIG